MYVHVRSIPPHTTLWMPEYVYVLHTMKHPGVYVLGKLPYPTELIMLLPQREIITCSAQSYQPHSYTILERQMLGLFYRDDWCVPPIKKAYGIWDKAEIESGQKVVRNAKLILVIQRRGMGSNN